MTYKDNAVKDLRIAYIGGGSRGWAWTFMRDLALEPALGGTIVLYDIDKEAAKANEIIGNGISEREEAVGKWKYIVADTLKEALTGSDFVVISILPGTFDEMESDVHEPEKYGIYQSVGDTAGPGGMVRALRTIPMFVTIAEAIRDYAPQAWVINYTNPMSLCVKTLYHVFPQIKAFGCCHEVFGTQKLLAQIAERELGIADIKRDEIIVNVLGLNHFTWFDGASYKGIDLFPVYRSFIEKHFEEGFEEEDKNWMNSTFSCAHRVKFDLFKKYGWIAAAGDRHLAEFMPPIYLKDPETVASWKFGLTTVAWRKEDLKKRLAKEERDLKSLINKRMNDTIINAQREIIAQLQQDIAQAESKKLASTVALNDDVITFRLAKDGKEVSKKIALVKNNRVINSKKVDEFIAIIDNGKYEEAYPIIVAEAKALIEAGYTVTDINGRELSAEEAEGYYVILDLSLIHI